jgi:hypothetical protein
MADSLPDRLREFDEFVWIHTADAFQQQFDTATDMADDVLAAFEHLLATVELGADEEALAKEIRTVHGHLGNPFLTKLIQLVGLTRNKLVTDVEAIGKAAGVIEAPARTYDALPRKPQHWPLALGELASRFRAVFGPSAAVADEDRAGVIETVNLATWPGYIRQERAKRQGHEAEGRLARICAAVGVPFAPAEKATQDIAADVQINGISFDLVFPDVRSPRACVISTVHTANIGQYGESKDAGDIAVAKEALATLDPKPLIIALADGLGFRSNRAGLEGVLTTADEFCQFRTMWKAVIVAAAVSGVEGLCVWLPDPTRFRSFLDRYDEAVIVLEDRPDEGVEAGDALLVS